MRNTTLPRPPRRGAHRLLAVALAWACGCAQPIDPAAARAIWQGLDAVQVARPLDPEYFRQGGLFTAETRCQGGHADSSTLLTHTWTKLDGGDAGSLSGTVDYRLDRCQASDAVRLHGRLLRALHLVQRLPEAAPAPAVSGGQRLTDIFYGELDVAGDAEGRCRVALSRFLVDGQARYEGTLCGHEAQRLLGGAR